MLRFQHLFILLSHFLFQITCIRLCFDCTVKSISEYSSSLSLKDRYQSESFYYMHIMITFIVARWRLRLCRSIPRALSIHMFPYILLTVAHCDKVDCDQVHVRWSLISIDHSTWHLLTIRAECRLLLSSPPPTLLVNQSRSRFSLVSQGLLCVVN